MPEELWKLRWKHDCDTYDIACEMNGLPVEKHEAEGILEKKDPGLLRRFDGAFFWKRMKELGHTHGNADICRCMQKHK